MSDLESTPAPRLAEVEAAIDEFGGAAISCGMHSMGARGERYNAARAALLALLGPAGVPAHEVVDEDDLCEDCLTQRATEFFETVPNQRCKDCTIKMLEEVCERLQAEKPTPVDDPQAKGRVAAILRDHPNEKTLDLAERIIAALSGTVPAHGAESEGESLADLRSELIANEITLGQLRRQVAAHGAGETKPLCYVVLDADGHTTGTAPHVTLDGALADAAAEAQERPNAGKPQILVCYALPTPPREDR